MWAYPTALDFGRPGTKFINTNGSGVFAVIGAAETPTQLLAVDNALTGSGNFVFLGTVGGGGRSLWKPPS